MHRPKPGVGFRPPQMKAGAGNFKPPASSQGSSGFKAPTPLFTQETSSQDSQNGNAAMHTFLEGTDDNSNDSLKNTISNIVSSSQEDGDGKKVRGPKAATNMKDTEDEEEEGEVGEADTSVMSSGSGLVDLGSGVLISQEILSQMSETSTSTQDNTSSIMDKDLTSANTDTESVTEPTKSTADPAVVSTEVVPSSIPNTKVPPPPAASSKEKPTWWKSGASVTPPSTEVVPNSQQKNPTKRPQASTTGNSDEDGTPVDIEGVESDQENVPPVQARTVASVLAHKGITKKAGMAIKTVAKNTAGFGKASKAKKLIAPGNKVKAVAGANKNGASVTHPSTEVVANSQRQNPTKKPPVSMTSNSQQETPDGENLPIAKKTIGSGKAGKAKMVAPKVSRKPSGNKAKAVAGGNKKGHWIGGPRRTAEAVTKKVTTKKKATASFSKGSLKQEMLKLQDTRDDGTWVECCKPECSKWRLLEDVKDPSEVPAQWYCVMNPDTRYNSCSAPQQDWEAYSKETPSHYGYDLLKGGGRGGFVDVAYTVGSVVMAKLDGWPWWPALVDDDPDTMQFFWTEYGTTEVSWYHVVFFDTRSALSRAWVRVGDIKPYNRKRETQLFTKGRPGTVSTKRLEGSVGLAEKALNIENVIERRKVYCFANKFTGKWGDVVDWSKGLEEVSNDSSDSHGEAEAGTSGNKRKRFEDDTEEMPPQKKKGKESSVPDTEDVSTADISSSED